jgi:NADH pyrophosphatase NudC (nudix superfamily)
MVIATVVVLAADLLMLVAFVVQPSLSREDDGAGRRARGTLEVLRRRAALLAERNRIYAAIRELDFDYSTNKVSDIDYAAQRHALVAQGVETLQQLDALPALDETPAEDPIEAAIVELRSGAAAPAAAAPARKAKGRSKAASGTSFCPRCGKPVQQGDLFCGSCGARL